MLFPRAARIIAGTLIFIASFGQGETRGQTDGSWRNGRDVDFMPKRVKYPPRKLPNHSRQGLEAPDRRSTRQTDVVPTYFQVEALPAELPIPVPTTDDSLEPTPADSGDGSSDDLRSSDE